MKNLSDKQIVKPYIVGSSIAILIMIGLLINLTMAVNKVDNNTWFTCKTVTESCE